VRRLSQTLQALKVEEGSQATEGRQLPEAGKGWELPFRASRKEHGRNTWILADASESPLPQAEVR
jgi:hypothetical protein